MISLNNLQKYFYRHKKNEIHVINDTSLEFKDSGLVALLGPSGCGKTTLLNCIGGLDKVNSGTLYINGEKITKKNFYKMDKIRNLNIGYIFQDYKLIDEWSVFDNVAVALKMCGIKNKAEIKKRVDDVLKIIELYRYRKRPASMLSGGERQRVGIARALVKNPSIIICDEPTGNLDSRNSIEIMNILKSISRERLVILVTHEVELARLYADRIVTLQDGKVISDEENHDAHEIDYGLEGKIYLKDLPISEEIKNDNVEVKYYSDSDKLVKINIVYKNGTIYIESKNKIETVNEDSAFEIINAHYKKINKSVYEKYNFNSEEIPNKKYASLYNIFTMIKVGFNRIKNYSLIRKLSLASFFIAGIMLMFSLSSIIGVSKVHLEDFNFDDETYLSINSNDGDALEKKISSLDNINFMMPGSMRYEFSIPVDDIFQTSDTSQYFEASLGSSEKLKEENLIYGRLPNEGEVVIDKRVFDKVSEEGLMGNNFLLIGIDSVDKLIGRNLNIGMHTELTIVGITDKVISEVFVNPSDLFRVVMDSSDYESLESDFFGDIYYYQDKFELKSGRLPNEGEVIINGSQADMYPLNKKSDIKLGNQELTVVGYYNSKDINLNLVSESTIKNYAFDVSNIYTISSSKKDETIESLRDAGILANDLYDKNFKEYDNNRKESINSSLISASVIIVITLFEIFFVIRSSFQSRIKEVGILRAIGVKRSDVYRMFAGEIIVATTIAGLSGIILCYAFIYALSDIQMISRVMSSNPLLIFVSAGILYIFNIIIGLLPVWLTVRSTPAAILSRKDI